MNGNLANNYHENLNEREAAELQSMEGGEITETALERTCEANPVAENSSLIFTVGVRPVPLYHFKLAYVVVHMAVKNFSKPTSKNGEIGRFSLKSRF